MHNRHELYIRLGPLGAIEKEGIELHYPFLFKIKKEKASN